jgi:hypothetical protein
MAKHDRTLAAVFATPTSGTVAWSDIEALLVSLGATAREGRGSRVRFRLNGVIGHFHRPHPRKEASKGCVESVRTFLLNAGIAP